MAPFAVRGSTAVVMTEWIHSEPSRLPKSLQLTQHALAGEVLREH